MEIKILKDIMESNKEMASEVKTLLKDKKVYMIDIMSSPGSGKTTLTDVILSRLKDKYNIAVIEGDIKTTKDAERLVKHNIPIVQIETERFGGDCHLESSWILKCFDSFDLDNLDFIIIENVGNLVCPAEFELGDDERVVVLSVTEGEDKPAKYPLAFHTSHTLILNKIDLLPYLDYSMDELFVNLKSVNPNLNIFEVSATKGDGIIKTLS
ncbi:hydrogenase nickel incorporation protein HypB [Spirochaetota bacterium]